MQSLEQGMVGQAQGLVQCCAALVVHKGGICSSLQQRFGHCSPASLHCSHVQGGDTVQLPHVHFCAGLPSAAA